MINVRYAKTFCCEEISLIENYNQAVASDEMWDVHHKLGLWFKRQWLIDNGFYYDQRAEMLMFIKRGEHKSLHHTGNRHHLGKPHSKETKQKMSEARKGRHLTEETKRKLSAMRTNHPALSKPVSQYTKDGEFIVTYPSANEAARQTGVDFSTISKCCRGIKKSAGGFIWRRVD